MCEYLVDVTLRASLRVNARTEDEARTLLEELLDCATANFGCDDGGDPIIGEVSLTHERPSLVEVDVEPVP